MFDLEAAAREAGLHPLPESTPLDWLDVRHEFGQDVGSLVPPGLDDYCRLLHPFLDDATSSPITWQNVAEITGLVPTSLPWDDPTFLADAKLQPHPTGSLPLQELDLLLGHLVTSGFNEECVFAFWDGYGWLGDGSGLAALSRSRADFVHRRGLHGYGRPSVHGLRGGVTVNLPFRSYQIFQGPVEGARLMFDHSIPQSPNLWWPLSRQWLVATEVDLAWTYVGGPKRLVQALIDDARLECARTRINDPISPWPRLAP